MTPPRPSLRRPRAGAACALLAVVVALGACGGDDEPQQTTTAPPAPTTTLPGTITTSTATTASTPTATGPEAPPAGSRGNLVVGIGEQQAAMFRDPRFRALGIEHVRLVVAYDAVRVKFEREIVDNWLREARRSGAQPFITFQHSRVRPKRLPSVAEFRADFRAFKRRYPQVRVYAAWNEINQAIQPTADAPARAAEYYNVVKAECGGCTVVAGDLLDQAGMTRYLAEYRRHLDGTPDVWGLHNYSDANRFRTSGLRRMLRAVRGDIWLTETGGLVEFGRNFPRDERRAARAVDYVLGLARDTPRVKRIYIYNCTGNARFDAGLTNPDGTTRPAYTYLRSQLSKYLR